jgi:hypothetical protein
MTNENYEHSNDAVIVSRPTLWHSDTDLCLVAVSSKLTCSANANTLSFLQRLNTLSTISGYPTRRSLDRITASTYNPFPCCLTNGLTKMNMASD